MHLHIPRQEVLVRAVWCLEQFPEAHTTWGLKELV
jgi:hypothetical protein